MSWPLSQDYNEAIQNPHTSFGDAELKTGEAVTNALGIPLPRSGNFADVYEVRCPSGSRWAVKCFTREVAGLRERYHEISKYLRQANLPFMVDFQYLEPGIRVRGQWYPILKMQWVEGFVLNEFVRDNLDKKPILQAMGQIWLRMARRLREANLAHCDLQHGNVLLVPGSTGNSLAVKLIDYDGMCVPALRGCKSGEVGHPAFQHPERLRTGAYNQEVDRFSLLAIATGLRCLTVGGRSLWERYDNGDNLLFRQSDLQAPTKSPLFEELLAIRDAQTQPLVKELYRACQGPLAKVPLLTDLVPEENPVASAVSRSKSPAATTAEPNAFQDIEAESTGRRSHRETTLDRSSSLLPWIAGGSVAACVLLGGVLLWALRSPSQSKNTALQPETLQAQAEVVVPAKNVVDKDVSLPAEKPQAIDAPTPPVEKSQPAAPPTPPVKSEDKPPKPEDKPPKPEIKVEKLPPTIQPEKPPVVTRLAVPDDAIQKKCTEDIHDIYKADYVSRQADDRIALAVKLLKRGMAKQEEVGRRYVYLREARDLAARSGDFALSLRAIDEMTKTFALQPLPLKTAALELAAKSLRGPDAPKFLVEQALTTVDEAEAVDDYEQALKLLRIAQSVAMTSRDRSVRGVVSQRQNRLKRLQTEYAKIPEAIRSLADKPGEAEANRIVGKFYSFDKEDWNKGLPMLARGADATLAELAHKDLANPTETSQQAQLGQAWWAFADKQSDTNVKLAGRRRARRWLLAALPSLSGSEADRVSSQLEVKQGKLKFRPGLVTELFAGENFERRVKARLDYKIANNWGHAAPGTGVPADHFSVRWQGILIPPRAGKYTFVLHADDGARLIVDDKTVIGAWRQIGRHTAEVALNANPHLIRVEFREVTGPAAIHFGWALDGGFKEQIVPPEMLYHDLRQERLLVP